MEALKTSTFLSDDNNDNNEPIGNHRNHYLQHSSPLSDSLSAHNHPEVKPITVMGFQHTSLPLWGVQFHPESVSTEHGQTMMDNFISETYQWMQKVTYIKRAEKTKG
jgi:para-aminobenzoate synthetase